MTTTTTITTTVADLDTVDIVDVISVFSVVCSTTISWEGVSLQFLLLEETMMRTRVGSLFPGVVVFDVVVDVIVVELRDAGCPLWLESSVAGVA